MLIAVFYNQNGYPPLIRYISHVILSLLFFNYGLKILIACFQFIITKNISKQNKNLPKPLP